MSDNRVLNPATCNLKTINTRVDISCWKPIKMCTLMYKDRRRTIYEVSKWFLVFLKHQESFRKLINASAFVREWRTENGWNGPICDTVVTGLSITITLQLTLPSLCVKFWSKTQWNWFFIHSPHLAPSNLFLLLWLKKDMKRKRFANIPKVKRKSNDALEGIQ